MQENYHYLIYQITNLINNKIYIGLHKTKNINDNYMGSGLKIKEDIKKFGVENFKKEILFDFKTEKEMIQKEAELVDKEFLLRDDVYNMTRGGNIGWGHFASEWGRMGAYKLQEKLNSDPIFKKEYFDHLHQGSNSQEAKIKRSKSIKLHWLKYNHNWLGKHHSEKTKQKMSITHKLNKHQCGNKNSQFGKCWVSNLELKETKSIKKIELDQYIKEGWLIGRIIDFNKFFEKYNDCKAESKFFHFIDFEKDIKENNVPRMLKNKKKSLQLNK